LPNLKNYPLLLLGSLSSGEFIFFKKNERQRPTVKKNSKAAADRPVNSHIQNADYKLVVNYYFNLSIFGRVQAVQGDVRNSFCLFFPRTPVLINEINSESDLRNDAFLLKKPSSSTF